MSTKKIQAAVLSLALLVPADAAFARTHHKKHHYSQTRGALIGAAAGAVIAHHHAVKGAVVGAALGEAIQYERNKKAH